MIIGGRVFVGTTPHPVTVTTRIITFLVGNPYKPSFATVTGWGVDLRYLFVNIGDLKNYPVTMRITTKQYEDGKQKIPIETSENRWFFWDVEKRGGGGSFTLHRKGRKELSFEGPKNGSSEPPGLFLEGCS